MQTGKICLYLPELAGKYPENEKHLINTIWNVNHRKQNHRET